MNYMNTTQVTSTGIAVAIAVVVAMGLLFFGPRVFAPFAATPSGLATTTTDMASTTAQTPSMDTLGTTQPIPNPLPTTLTGTDEVIGTGKEATAGTNVTVNYVGMLPDGTVFDASAPRGQAFTFALGAGQVIKGWDQGVAGMKEGGTRRLIIPADLAYGSQDIKDNTGRVIIPGGSTLIFDVELLKVQ